MGTAGVLDQQRDLDPVFGAEFGQQPGYVGFDGGQAHVQLGGDGVGVPVGDGAQIVVLATSSPVPVIDAVWLSPGSYVTTVGPKQREGPG